MKRIYLSFVIIFGLLLCNTYSALAQHDEINVLPNTDFESWGFDDEGSDSAFGWTSTDQAFVGAAPVWLVNCTWDMHGGRSSVILGTAPLGFLQWPILGVMVNGNAQINHIIQNPDSIYYAGGGGSPVNQMPKEFSGFYKYYHHFFTEDNPSPTTPDSALIQVITSRYNTILNKRDTITLDTLWLTMKDGTTMTEWEPFQMRLSEADLVVPDTVTIVICSSNPLSPQKFSQLMLDDIALDFGSSTGVKGEGRLAALKLYPNPTSNTLWINLSENTEEKWNLVQVFDVKGTEVKRINLLNQPIMSSFLKLDVSDLAEGLYFCRVNGDNVIKEAKFVKQN